MNKNKAVFNKGAPEDNLGQLIEETTAKYVTNILKNDQTQMTIPATHKTINWPFVIA